MCNDTADATMRGVPQLACAENEDEMKVHLHDEQFDGHPHPWCGRGTVAVSSLWFEATEPAQRCKICEREWFPHGQPEWHQQQAARRIGEG